MDSNDHKHSRMDDVIRNYYGSVQFRKRRKIADMEKTIRGHYAPADRRSAVLRNYYGVTGDMVRQHYRGMEHMLENYYGQADWHNHEAEGHGASGEAATPAATVVTAKSFDDGEVLVQKEAEVQKDKTGEEYIVEKTFEEEPCEE